MGEKQNAASQRRGRNEQNKSRAFDICTNRIPEQRPLFSNCDFELNRQASWRLLQHSALSVLVFFFFPDEYLARLFPHLWSRTNLTSASWSSGANSRFSLWGPQVCNHLWANSRRGSGSRHAASHRRRALFCTVASIPPMQHRRAIIPRAPSLQVHEPRRALLRLPRHSPTVYMFARVAVGRQMETSVPQNSQWSKCQLSLCVSVQVSLFCKAMTTVTQQSQLPVTV